MDKEKLISKLKKIGLIILWVVMGGGMIMGLTFANKEEEKTKCSEILVHIEEQDHLQFVDREMVLRTIRPDGDERKIIGQRILTLNSALIERKLEANKLVRRAEVFTDMNGVLHINIRQREPVLRVINASGEGFYIDRDGAKMPLSAGFTARVPVATGNIFERYEGGDSVVSFVGKELLKIATYVDKDAFWKAQIEQIFVTGESELVLIPKVGDQTIIFGNTENMEEKFGKLLLFYREALSRMGWDHYSSIDLRYKDQIVCKKKINS